MPLPDPRPVITHAPARAGIGLRPLLLRARARRPMASWPADWWQRNYDQRLEPDGPDPVPLTPRMKQVPGFPYEEAP